MLPEAAEESLLEAAPTFLTSGCIRSSNDLKKDSIINLHNIPFVVLCLYGVRNLDMSIRFSLKSRPSEGIPRPEMSQIKADISLHTNLKLIFHKNVGWQGYQWIP